MTPRNDDFDDGYERGRTAVRRTAGWLTGFGGELLGSAADRIRKAAERKRERAAERAAQRELANRQRQQALANRALYLDSEIVREEARLKRTRLHAYAWPLAIGVVTLFATRATIAEWDAPLIFAVLAYLASAVIIKALRDSRLTGMKTERRRLS